MLVEDIKQQKSLVELAAKNISNSIRLLELYSIQKDNLFDELNRIQKMKPVMCKELRINKPETLRCINLQLDYLAKRMINESLQIPEYFRLVDWAQVWLKKSK